MTFEKYVSLVESLEKEHLMNMDRSSSMVQLAEFSKNDSRTYQAYRDRLRKGRRNSDQ